MGGSQKRRTETTTWLVKAGYFPRLAAGGGERPEVVAIKYGVASSNSDNGGDSTIDRQKKKSSEKNG